jgi:hypothetical protein
VTVARKLEWGETPWDNWPREKLLREVQRMYAALVSARSPLAMMKQNDPASPFWGLDGTGGCALAKVEQTLAPYPNEPAYRTFFRYATDLLFDGLGQGWMVCDKCDCMTAGVSNRDRPKDCASCAMAGRPRARVRRLRWSDLKPKERR